MDVADKNVLKNNVLRTLSITETQAVNGGLLGVIVTIAAIILSGCASIPSRPHPDDRR